MYDQNEQPRTRLFTTGDVAKYALLPGVFPRMRRLAEVFTGFMFMFTQILGTTDLIDKNHPCLRYENRFAYPFSYALALAWSNLKFDRKHLSQILMFFTVVLSILLLGGMMFTFLTKFFVQANEAHAQFFSTPPAETGPEAKYLGANYDWAFKFLDRIFGDDTYTGVDFWTHTGADGGGAVEGAQNPWFTAIFAGMLQHYSMALLFIAAMMILYLLITTVGEAARTGEPFGTRFDSVWAPIRLALAIGLLVPVSGKGYNAAQLIVFQASEWGSNLATNTWNAGITAMKDVRFVTTPRDAKMARFIHDMLMINICTQSIVDPRGPLPDNDSDIRATVYRSDMPGKSIYTYGVIEDTSYCGQVIVPRLFTPFITTPRDYDVGGKVVTYDVPDTEKMENKIVLPKDMPGPASEYLNNLVRANITAFFRFAPYNSNVGIGIMNGQLLTGASPTLEGNDPSGVCVVKNKNDINTTEPCTVTKIATWDSEKTNAIDNIITPVALLRWVNSYKGVMQYGGKDGSGNYPATAVPYDTQVLNDGAIEYNKWMIHSLRKDAKYGWTTAGVFYMRLSNAFALIEKATEGPNVKLMPKNFTKYYATPGFSTMPNEFLLAICSSWVLKVLSFGAFNESCNSMKAAITLSTIIRQASGNLISAPISNPSLYEALGGTAWTDELAQPDPDSPTNVSSDSMFGVVSKSLVDAVKISSENINPLGQVISWGNNLMSIALVMYGIAIVGSLLSPAIADIFVTLGFSFIIPGFILAFFVPMQPFLYFMFAVIEWMISIIEAIIGVPLWCLSFISLEGDLLGKSMNGVKMIFELVLRPTIIVMSLVVSILIFTASIGFVNDSFSLFLGAYEGANASNMGPVTGAVGGFAMMLIYMFLIYSLATSCFKLIDVIPNKFGRWLDLPEGFGANIKTGVDQLAGAVATGAAFGAVGSTIKGGAAAVQQGKNSAAAGKQQASLNNIENQNTALGMQTMNMRNQLLSDSQAKHNTVMNTMNPPPPPSDRRLKENIVPRGQENGFNIYSFNYIGDPKKYIGVMADEVKAVRPDAVLTDETGFMRVYYDRIDVAFREEE